MNSPITTHILDTSKGIPADGVAVILTRKSEEGFVEIARGVTDEDGRIGDLLRPKQFAPGEYRLTFEIGDYFAAQNKDSFYPRATVEFRVADANTHYHVPLLLNPFGYSTYRGS